MDREDIIPIANQTNLGHMFHLNKDASPGMCHPEDIEKFAALASEAGAAAERNKLADWMKRYGFATGHGDTMEQLCDALGTEIVDRIEMEVDAQRELCAKACDDASAEIADAEVLAERIRARSEK